MAILQMQVKVNKDRGSVEKDKLNKFSRTGLAHECVWPQELSLVLYPLAYTTAKFLDLMW